MFSQLIGENHVLTTAIFLVNTVYTLQYDILNNTVSLGRRHK